VDDNGKTKGSYDASLSFVLIQMGKATLFHHSETGREIKFNFFLKFFRAQPILLSVEDKEVDGKGTETLIKNSGKQATRMLPMRKSRRTEHVYSYKFKYDGVAFGAEYVSR